MPVSPVVPRFPKRETRLACFSFLSVYRARACVSPHILAEHADRSFIGKSRLAEFTYCALAQFTPFRRIVRFYFNRQMWNARTKIRGRRIATLVPSLNRPVAVNCNPIRIKQIRSGSGKKGNCTPPFREEICPID